MAKKKARKAPGVKEAKATVTLTIQSVAVAEEAAAKRKLPRGTVTLAPGNKVAIDVAKVNRSLVRDQRARMVSSMGCVSAPGGPSC